MTQTTTAPKASPTAATAPRAKRRRTVKPSCERCYFGRRGLCALELDEPCSTFRPDSPEGLVPPTQPALLIRNEPLAEPPSAALADPLPEPGAAAPVAA